MHVCLYVFLRVCVCVCVIAFMRVCMCVYVCVHVSLTILVEKSILSTTNNNYLPPYILRTSAFWDEVIIPQLKLKKRILIVGHENNLRSLIKRLDDISETDILQLELPRAIPLIYDLDAKTFKPIKNKKTKDGKSIDHYNGVGVEVDLLSGRYICDPAQLKNIAKRDQQQVYDLRYKNTLEIAPYLGNNPISPDRATPIIIVPTNSNSHHIKHMKKDGKEVKEGKVGEEKFKLNE